MHPSIRHPPPRSRGYRCWCTRTRTTSPRRRPASSACTRRWTCSRLLSLLLLLLLIIICMHVCVCIYIYIYIHVCMYIYIYIHTCMCIYIYICIHTYMYNRHLGLINAPYFYFSSKRPLSLFIYYQINKKYTQFWPRL